MATTPYFLWPPHSSSSTGALDSDTASGFGTGLAPEMSLTPATTTTTTATAAADTALVSPVRERAAPVARPRMRRNASSGSGKQQQQAGGGGAKKPPQRGLGVAELERLRCGGDPLRELGLGVLGGGDAQVHPLLHCNHPHHLATAPAFDAATARYCSSLLVQQPPPPPAPPRPAGPGCYVHHPGAAAGGQQRAPLPPLVAPEQQYFMDRWGRMGGFTPTGGSGAGAGGGDHHQTTQLLPLLAPPEHPSSQNTIWRPAASSSSTCLQSGHRCDLCSRRMMRAFAAERGAQPPATPPSPTAAGITTTATPDYSIYDLAAAMATARQGDAFMARDRKRGPVITGEEAARKEVREIEFFPAASTHRDGGVTHRPDESEFVAPMSSSYGAAAAAGSYAAAPLDLSLRL